MLKAASGLLCWGQNITGSKNLMEGGVGGKKHLSWPIFKCPFLPMVALLERSGCLYSLNHIRIPAIHIQVVHCFRPSQTNLSGESRLPCKFLPRSLAMLQTLRNLFWLEMVDIRICSLREPAQQKEIMITVNVSQSWTSSSLFWVSSAPMIMWRNSKRKYECQGNVAPSPK